MSTEIAVDSTREPTETHSSSSNPFAFTPKTLSPLAEPTQKKQSLKLLKSYGGLDGLVKGLHTNQRTGLKDETASLKPITLREITGESNDNIVDEQDNVQYETTLTADDTLFYQRKNVFGKNILPVKKTKSILELMWIAMQEKVLILLIIAAVVSLGLGLYEDFGVKDPATEGQPKIRWVEGVAIIIAFLIVVLVGSLNDWQKERQFQKLNAKKEDRNVKVTRNGKEALLSVHDVLVGDVLNLEPGDVISVDGVLIAGHNLRCDESAASGESDAVRKMKYEDCLKELEKESESLKVDPFIISGSKVLEGVGTYIVTGVGVNSFFGKIMMSLRSEAEDTPLQEKLNDLAEKIAKLGGAAALLMFIVLLIKYFVSFRNGVPSVTHILDNLIKIIISTVTIVVVAVPEGLPLAVTLALAYATTRMLKDNNLVRVLSACETMGNATTICSDKTGTLTQNKMTVVTGIIGLSVPFVKDAETHSLSANVVSTKPVSLKEINSEVPQDISQLLNESIAINSTAFEGEIENGKKTFVGSKTETALLGFLLELNPDNDIKSLRESAQIVQLFPFNSERKSMGVVIKIDDSKWRFFVKGASEVILKKSNKIINIVKSDDNTTTSSVIDLTEDNSDKVQKVIEDYATQTLRTIGIAYRDFEKFQFEEITKSSDEINYGDLFDKLTLLSIVGIEDPLREGVREAVANCVKAGVKVRMVTGDNILTAKSIATQCGIFTGGEVMEGPEFRNLSLEQMNRILPKLQVLARSSPDDKRILVGHLRRLNDVVAVTGDGTNDGPALKLSDVGFSMGIAGTEVAKEASSIILMDDNFSSIVKAIMWGRNVNDAVKKFLQFQLTVNVTAVLLTFISAVSSNEQKSVLTAVQLLWVNLIMDTLAALALATDPPTIELLDRKPESKNAPLISLDMWKMIIGQSIFQLVITLVLFYAGGSILGLDKESIELQTVIFNTFVFLQIFNEINCRRLHGKINILKGVTKNKFLIAIFLIMVCGQILIVEFGGAAFQVTRISIIEWVICIVLGFLSIPVGIIIRLIPTAAQTTTPPPAVNVDLEKEWSDTITQVQNQLHFFKTLRGGRFRAHFGDKQEKSETRSKAIAAAAMLPSLISASVGVHMTRENTEQNENLDLGRQLRNDSNEGINSSSTSKNQNDTNVDTIDIEKK
ncbi:PMCA-type calcium-translocating P-type ATPase [Rhizophagus irregularis]|uniref:Calcium-transporting ATPase n=1 Tax=Rhizophagus irregularis TaxID=588596 RepID=A0A2N1N2F2_9GLOM|nr:PMCA-type calcium-translocating P-type ATPase [Rhizophagus irregularis]